MSVDHECDFPDTCNVCRGPIRPAADPTTVVLLFPARHHGHCPECDLGIHKGQRIAALSDNRYVHATGCADDYRGDTR